MCFYSWSFFYRRRDNDETVQIFNYWWGMTADAAVRGIRQVDDQGGIAILSDEENVPYARPPLTKGLWKGKEVETIWRRTEELNVDLHLGCRAARIDPNQYRAVDDQTEEYEFEKLLIATGGE
jgi:NAD(P)H-nitrite reductase large subunit